MSTRVTAPIWTGMLGVPPWGSETGGLQTLLVHVPVVLATKDGEP